MSETDCCRELLKIYCSAQIGMDVGYGGSKIVPHAWAFDMLHPYTTVGDDRQQLQGDAATFPFLCDGALDWMFSSHLLEDFTYIQLVDILTEWRRVLRDGGLLVTNCPDQQRFKAWIAKTGQGDNLAHKEQDFSLDNFKQILDMTGKWEEVYEMPDDSRYSWYYVCRKV